MNLFQVCSKCACYVKVEDEHCPFCGAPSERRRPPSPAWRDPGRVSRGHWLALGSALSLSAAGCGETVTQEEQAPPVSRSVAADGGPIVACSSRSGYFPCGTDAYCDRSIQACGDDGCESYELLSEQFVAPPACGACPTCACLNIPPSSGPDVQGFTCSEDDAGTVSVISSQNSSQNACYGAPPARLERLS